MYTELPNLDNEEAYVKDFLMSEENSNEIAKRHGFKTGHILSEKVRKNRKTPIVTFNFKEELESFLAIVPGKQTFARWLGLSPSKATGVLYKFLLPEDEFKYMYEELGMTNREIARKVNNPYITASMLKDKAKRLGLMHKEGDLEKAHERGIAEYLSDTDRVTTRNENMRQTMINKYGVDSISPLSVKEINDKAKETVSNNNGGLGMASEYVKEKAINTLLDRYGVDNNKKSIELLAETIEWHETKYVKSAKDALELVKPNIEGISDKLLSLLQELVESGEYENFTLKQVYSEVLGLRYGFMSNKEYNVHPDGKLIVSDYRLSQNEVVDYLVSLGISTSDIVRDSYPNFMEGKQLDIYLPKYNFAIEFNGSFWHANKGANIKKPKEISYHAKKTKLAREADVNLMHIWEYDWKDEVKQAIVKSQIKYHLNRVSNKYYARKLEVKEVSYSDKKAFLQANHIQGDVVSSEAYGLYDNEGLVSLMTFGKRRFDNKQGWELLRFANKLDSSVAGGASKLLKHFSDNHRGDTLISYANNDFAYSGYNSLYSKLGFTYVKTTVPGYKWVSGSNKVVVPRYSAQVHKLKAFTAGEGPKTFELEEPDFSETDTENSYMVRHGFYKVYDAGNDLYELNM